MGFPDAGLYLLLATWGGLVALDGTGCGQFMLSRPFVAATLAGLISGDALAGATIGVVLEAFHLMVLPVGAARYPEAGPPAVVAGALFALSNQLPSTLLSVLVFFLVWERLAGRTVQLYRQINSRVVTAGSQERMGPVELQRKHLAAMSIDFVRGALLVGLGLPLLWLVIRASGPLAALDQRIPQTLIAAAVICLVSGSLHLFGGRRRLFVAGITGGLLFLLLRQ